ncbi:hypothetical protein CH256_22495 [Rhodococcus sp. 05-2254-6]|uniref:hypothetical protein n=1 Tax=Rhodococcus sp. 05-2254-6 TaxID=2022489 RepID=UPI000B9B56F9|nr:hypothetical protein [Rhodococcus sp. 05-2254-6]OZE22376.1 hypothetical protein CH256_22495 [Rhodococcus sp. 05-2254-6]
MSTKKMKRDLRADLAEQRYFLRASCDLYDAGNVVEAKRIAVVLRVLVHDTFYPDGKPNSRSLLSLMGVKSKLQWITVGAVDPANLLSSLNLTFMTMETTETGTQFSYTPYSEEDVLARGHLVDFETWWNEPMIKDGHGEHFSRKDLVLALANKDGGAHIDDLQRRVAALANEGSTGWSVGAGDPSNPGLVVDNAELITITPLLASVRSIASEVSLVFTNQAAVLDATDDGSSST